MALRWLTMVNDGGMGVKMANYGKWWGMGIKANYSKWWGWVLRWLTTVNDGGGVLR